MTVGPIKIVGLGLICVSGLFFWQAAEGYRTYSAELIRLSDPRYATCLGCGMTLELERGIAESMTFWGTMFVLAGSSLTIFSLWSDNRRKRLQERQD